MPESLSHRTAEPRPVDRIVEDGVGSIEYTALHVSEVQAGASGLAEVLKSYPSVPAEFRELLARVAAFKVRL